MLVVRNSAKSGAVLLLFGLFCQICSSKNNCLFWWMRILLEIMFSQFEHLFVIQSSWWHIKDNAWVNTQIILPQTDPSSALWWMKLKLTRPLARNRLSDYRCYFPISSPLCHARSNPLSIMKWSPPPELGLGRGRQSGATWLSAPVSGSLPWWQHNTVQLPVSPVSWLLGFYSKCARSVSENPSQYSRDSPGGRSAPLLVRTRSIAWQRSKRTFLQNKRSTPDSRLEKYRWH